MKRLLSLSVAISASFVLAMGTVAHASTYEVRDLSPSIPQKTGKFFDGVWNDGMNWLVTNGSMLYTVEGAADRLANLTPEIQKYGMFKIVAAAPEATGRWIVLGSHNGTDSQYASEVSNDGTDVMLEEINGESAQNIPIPNGVHLTGWIQLKTSDGGIYLVAHAEQATDVYAYANGQFAFIQPGPTADAVIENGVDMGRTWGLGFHDLGFIPSASVVAARYGMTNPRDAFLVDNVRSDGEALLTGYGENGLRIIVAVPTAKLVQENGLTDLPLRLTVTRLHGSTSAYVVTADIESAVPYIRILKNGIGIKKCDSGGTSWGPLTCSITVDERGTADRYEAWAPSAAGSFNVTSKAVVLRDTTTITASSWNDENAWDPKDGTYAYRGAWSWLAPSSLDAEAGERVDWHVGLWREVTLAQRTTCLDTNHPSDTSYCDKLRVTKDTAGLSKLSQDAGSLKVEIYVDGKLKQTCSPSADEIAKNRAGLNDWSDMPTAKIVVSLNDCSTSVSRMDDASLLTTYTSWMLPGYVRVYAKFSWTELGQKHVMVSPTDVVRFKPSV